MKKWTAAVLFAAAVLFLLSFVVPPFQNPDEPHHFAAAVLYARGEEAREGVESGVIRMMDRANWWRLVGIGRPQPLPKQISEIDYLMEGMETGDFRDRLARFELWHRIAGRAMRPVAGWSLERLYYLGRIASSILLIGTFFLLWRAFELLSVIFGRIVRWGFYLALFLPQFWMIGTSVSPDAFVVLLCAAFFYGAAALLVGEKARAGQMALVAFLPIIGVLADRAAFVLLPMALLAAVLAIRRENVRTFVPWMLIGAIGAILAIYFAALRYPFEAESIYQSAKTIVEGGAKSVFGMLDIGGFARSFWAFVADGVLLKFGWLVFGVPKAIYWVWRILLVLAGLGLAVRLVKWAKDRMRDEGGEAAKKETVGQESGPAEGRREEPAGGRAASIRTRWFLLAIAAVAVQAVGMWAFYGTKGMLGQGRYFFPVIIPVAFLLALGLNEFGDMIKKGAGRKVLAGVIMGELLLLVTSVWLYIVPAFHLILLGPHPGV